MCEEIFLSIQGKPIAKKTHRDECRIDWSNKSVKRWRRFPQSKEAQQIGLEMKAQYSGPPLETAVFMICEFYMPIPVRWNKKIKQKAREGKIHHLHKPDATNLAKFYEDCMKNIVLHDDCKIVWVTPVKLYDDNPRTEILIKPFNYDEYQRFQQAFGRGTS